MQPEELETRLFGLWGLSAPKPPLWPLLVVNPSLLFNPLFFNLEGSGDPWIIGLESESTHQVWFVQLKSASLFYSPKACYRSCYPAFLPAPTTPPPLVVWVLRLFRNLELWLSQRLVWRLKSTECERMPSWTKTPEPNALGALLGRWATAKCYYPWPTQTPALMLGKWRQRNWKCKG